MTPSSAVTTLALLCASLAVGAPAPPEEKSAAPAPASSHRLTVFADELSLPRYLDVLSAQTGVSFVVGSGLDELLITASIEDGTVEQALQVLRARGLEYKRMPELPGETYIVGRNLRDGPGTLKTGGCDFPKTPVSFDALDGMLLGRFLKQLGKQAGVAFAYGPGVEMLMMKGRARDEPLNDLMFVLANTKGLSCSRRKDGAFLLTKDKPAP